MSLNKLKKNYDKLKNNYKKLLDLGWCQGYMALQYHMEEAILEKYNPGPAPKVAKFSHKYYNEIQKIKNNKIYDFCWIGSIESSKEHRLWIIDFAKKHFTKNSIFINTDFPDDWEKLGDYDLTLLNFGYNPKLQKDNQSKEVQYRKVEDNLYYFKAMRQSKFTLCPRGDAPWAFRFYEILMCETIPIVNSIHDTYRNFEESLLDYKYLLQDNKEFIYDETLIEHNTKIFRENHLFNLS
jgi:hypothetical protein